MRSGGRLGAGWIAILSVLAWPALAQEGEDPVGNRSWTIPEIILLESLTIKPQVLTSSDDGSTTVGVRYKYDRPLEFTRTQLGGFEIEGSIRSAGLFTVKPSQSPERALEHLLELTLIDLLDPFLGNPRLYDPVTGGRLHRLYECWLAVLNDVDLEECGDETAAQLARQGQHVLRSAPGAGTTDLGIDEAGQLWAALDRFTDDSDAFFPLHLSFDLQGGAETTQNFDEAQYVASGQLRGKWSWDPLDLPIAVLFGKRELRWPYGTPGLYFATGVAYVNPTDNDEYQAIAGNDDGYARVNVQAFYRTLLANTSMGDVGFEFEFQYYHQVNAPRGIIAADLDDTTFYRATAYFHPGRAGAVNSSESGDLFLEYTSGRLPLGIDKEQTVRIGWRYSFR